MTHLLSHLIHSAPRSHSIGGNKLTAKGREVLKDAVEYNKEAADELLFSEAALCGKEAGAPPGRLELRRRSSGGAVVRWRPDKGGASTEIDVAAIKEIQNWKRENRMAMIKVTMKGGSISPLYLPISPPYLGYISLGAEELKAELDEEKKEKERQAKEAERERKEEERKGLGLGVRVRG